MPGWVIAVAPYSNKLALELAELVLQIILLRMLSRKWRQSDGWECNFELCNPGLSRQTDIMFFRPG